MDAKLYKISCLTNLHVGSGDVNFNIIDQEVEKDIDGYPTVYASGLKGALRDAYKGTEEKHIFGDAAKDNVGTAGAYKFFDAKLLARPLRVARDPQRAYILVTSISAINEFIRTTKVFGCCPKELEEINDDFFLADKEFVAYGNVKSEINIEGSKKVIILQDSLSDKLKSTLCTLKRVLGVDAFAIAKDLNQYDLPVVARNSLNKNGISNSLWYEEFVPHESVFWMITLVPDGEDASWLTRLPYVQLGGNASVGYGYTKFEEIR